MCAVFETLKSKTLLRNPKPLKPLNPKKGGRSIRGLKGASGADEIQVRAHALS